MSISDIIDVEIPDTDPAENPTCEICGVDLEYSGRGRKPKRCDEHRRQATKPTSRRTTKDVETAIAVLEGVYSTVSMGLLLASPTAASVWAQQIESLQKQNRVTLAGDPNLAKSICRLGERSGKAAFMLSHVIALAPVVMVIRQEMPKRPRKAKAAPAPEPERFDVVTDETNNVADLRFFG